MAEKKDTDATVLKAVGPEGQVRWSTFVDQRTCLILKLSSPSTEQISFLINSAASLPPFLVYPISMPETTLFPEIIESKVPRMDQGDRHAGPLCT